MFCVLEYGLWKAVSIILFMLLVTSRRENRCASDPAEGITLVLANIIQGSNDGTVKDKLI